jgi:hypothetical protein
MYDVRLKPSQFVIILIITILSTGAALSQGIEKAGESVVIKEHFDSLYNFDPRLVSGDYYQPKMSISDGHPFFISPEWKKGSVILDGTQFDNLLLKYDVSSNEIILNTKTLATYSLQMVLKKKHISSIEMGGRYFRPFTEKFQSDSSFFCEVLVRGEIEYLLLKSKYLSVVSGGISKYKYLTNQAEYLQINDSLYRYHGRRTLFKLFPQIKSELRDYLKAKNLKYTNLKIDDTVRLVTYCKSLLKEKK